MKIDSASQFLYFSFWAGDMWEVYLYLAKCELLSNGSCIDFTVLNSTNQCTYVYYKSTCLDIDEKTQRLYYCFCDSYEQFDVYSSNFDGSDIIEYNIAQYVGEDNYLSGALSYNQEFIAFAWNHWESSCTLFFPGGYGQTVAPLQCVDGRLTR